MRQVYILGAGFSKCADFPLVYEFQKAFTQHRPLIARRFGQVRVKQLEEVLAIDPNPEEAFERLVGEVKKTELLIDAIHAVLVACNENFNSNGPNLPEYRYYQDFFQLVVNQNATVITLNQDTVLEIILAKHYLKNFAGHTRNFELVRFDYGVPGWEPFCPIQFAKNGPQFERNVDIDVLKLHGGTNFFRCTKHGWAFTSDNINSSHSGICLRPLSADSQQVCDLPVRFAIIPPTRAKQVAPFGDIWKVASERLKKADVITLIGLALNPADDDFLTLIREALAANPTCQLGIINRGGDEAGWQAKVKKSLGADIPIEQIFLKGFDEWIKQFQR